MKRNPLQVLGLGLLCLNVWACGVAQGQTPASMTIPVDARAFLFSPGNWSGDAGRDGHLYRQTWNAGAYFRVHWSNPSANPTATLLLDTSTYANGMEPPVVTYNVDGIWTSYVACQAEMPIAHLTGAGSHTLTVYVAASPQQQRWGTAGQSGLNVVRVKGLQVDAGSDLTTMPTLVHWALEIGDSITEGIGTDNGRADNLSDYSYFVGQALKTQGFEYGVNACGWSGWLWPGDNPPASDVPAYYFVSGSANGVGGTYDDAKSRWNKLDANHSLLDSRGHLSAYGKVGQEPNVITINYGTNDSLHGSNASDTQASVTQCLTALRKAAPNAYIFLIVPFGQYDVEVIRQGAKAYQIAHHIDTKFTMIDLGATVAKSLADGGYWGGLHPNMRGHAVFATQILAAIEEKIHRIEPVY